MIIIETKDFGKLFPDVWNGDVNFLFEALDINNIKYSFGYAYLNLNDNILEKSIKLALESGWDPDKCSSFPVPISSSVTSLLIINADQQTLVNNIKRTFNIRAFA